MLITDDLETLMRQASMTAADYFDGAVQKIDQKFGLGYSSKHPDLVGAFMRVAAKDFETAILAKVIGEGVATLSRTLDETASRITAALESGE